MAWWGKLVRKRWTGTCRYGTAPRRPKRRGRGTDFGTTKFIQRGWRILSAHRGVQRIGKLASLTRPGRRQLAADAVGSDWRKFHNESHMTGVLSSCAAARPIPHDATGLKIASYSGTNATRRGGERPGRAMRASWTDSMKMGRPCGRGARSVRQRVEMVPGSRVRPSMGKQKMFCSCRCHCRCPGRAGLSPSGGWVAARQYDGRPGRRSCLRSR